jgi:hypothetical protein
MPATRARAHRGTKGSRLAAPFLADALQPDPDPADAGAAPASRVAPGVPAGPDSFAPSPEPTSPLLELAAELPEPPPLPELLDAPLLPPPLLLETTPELLPPQPPPLPPPAPLLLLLLALLPPPLLLLALETKQDPTETKTLVVPPARVPYMTLLCTMSHEAPAPQGAPWPHSKLERPRQTPQAGLAGVG